MKVITNRDKKNGARLFNRSKKSLGFHRLSITIPPTIAEDMADLINKNSYTMNQYVNDIIKKDLLEKGYPDRQVVEPSK